ncbi:hypothetical protein [Bosea sp. (in: a-proteobacteria)]|jgi:hypothetical protein|uniref:hypothetical protein n=1 Tax=Bosea sp. (in: a-proteobacteria) TaxID=1871050 RepID=UPI002DDCD135|nr:hypothetical protein [Bosea sp. (in: a-proteobacteria)]HEV2509104.1 hypothetical protein [Bosea sp. (in: a-proteobacteria)]
MTARHIHALPAMLALCGTFAFAHVATANECLKVAPGSYSADRSISGPDASLRVKVFVSGGKLREESSGQAGPEVKIMSAPGRGVVLFNPETKVGSRLPAPPNTRRRDIKVNSQDRGDGTVLVTITADVNGQPQQISQLTCRKDGVLIEARHTIPDEQGNSKGTLVIRDSNVVVGPQPASLFAVPGGVKFVR